MKDEFRYTDEQQAEARDWLESLDEVIDRETPERIRYLLRQLQTRAHARGIRLPFTANTPYINTIPRDEQQQYPGNIDIERRVRSIIRWNAMAMVVRGNKNSEGIGGHISTYASAATLYEVGFNHFFRGPDHECGGDIIYIQGHAAPGIYARAFLEGRLSEQQLENFRRELAEGGGLSSYPHPRLMPDFWQYPTVSMGLGPIMAIYTARFNRYLEDRGLKPPTDAKVWAFIGDGETDEPESLGAITLPAREKLDNLIFVINCNLQRLDGPVRGNGKIIQELEAAFRGAGWNVIKVIWGEDWDALLAQDDEDALVQRMNDIVDGQYQKYTVETGAYTREHFCDGDKRLLKIFSHLTDEQIRNMRRGGHDTQKVYAAYHAAIHHRGSPTVILAKTIKGYGLGEMGEGKNITHSQKKLNEDELREFRTRFGIPISDDDVAFAPFHKPPADSPEMIYMNERRTTLGGYLPSRSMEFKHLDPPSESIFEEFNEGTKDRAVSTTMAFVRILSKLLSDKDIGKYIVPIVPDEARTFGMEALFRQVGIYSHIGQLYEPVDSDNLLYYKEATDGQILEEGLTEAGSMSSFIAAGTAYSAHGIPTIPFYIYYSMFGIQRIGDLVWAAGDMQCKGFLIGATAGRTTLNGEGLQHQDGHSHLAAYPISNLLAYDPAFAYELAVIIRDGIRRMYVEGEHIFYYLTVENENYPMPPMPEGVEDGILKGLYKFRASTLSVKKKKAHLFGSGAILNAALEAQEILETSYGVAADVWSVTSYKALYMDAREAERWNLLHPGESPKIPYLTQCLKDDPGVVVAASDYVKALPDSISQWVPNPMSSLGTDGFGLSETREALRDHFEVDARFITLSVLTLLAREGAVNQEIVSKAIRDLKIDPKKENPATR
ncbi:MAG: pyruvate dehydrogenase (acetyl-transferring), homodimeric type [Candidatus Hydrogenedentes bacterium]|nr:pyruvate dehydrogenase (acetyl-transferring), homodimeric type [Candidatus Hydrogenedentota bacterium]